MAGRLLDPSPQPFSSPPWAEQCSSRAFGVLGRVPSGLRRPRDHAITYHREPCPGSANCISRRAAHLAQRKSLAFSSSSERSGLPCRSFVLEPLLESDDHSPQEGRAPTPPSA